MTWLYLYIIVMSEWRNGHGVSCFTCSDVTKLKHGYETIP